MKMTIVKEMIASSDAAGTVKPDEIVRSNVAACLVKKVASCENTMVNMISVGHIRRIRRIAFASSTSLMLHAVAFWFESMGTMQALLRYLNY